MKTIFTIFCLIIYLAKSERIKIHTIGPEKERDYHFFPLKTKYLEFNIKAQRQVHIMLCNQYGYDGPHYEIIIGGIGNTLSVIRNNQTSQYADTYAGAILRESYQRIWVTINDTAQSISVGQTGNTPFLYLHDPFYMKMDYFGIASGWGANAYWDFDYKMLKYNN